MRISRHAQEWISRAESPVVAVREGLPETGYDFCQGDSARAEAANRARAGMANAKRRRDFMAHLSRNDTRRESLRFRLTYAGPKQRSTRRRDVENGAVGCRDERGRMAGFSHTIVGVNN